jgi:hypothetical protein
VARNQRRVVRLKAGLGLTGVLQGGFEAGVGGLEVDARAVASGDAEGVDFLGDCAAFFDADEGDVEVRDRGAGDVVAGAEGEGTEGGADAGWGDGCVVFVEQQGEEEIGQDDEGGADNVAAVGSGGCGNRIGDGGAEPRED